MGNDGLHKKSELSEVFSFVRCALVNLMREVNPSI